MKLHKKKQFSATYIGKCPLDHGKKFSWKFYRDGSHGWFLEDYEGYERYVGKTWAESVPVIQRIIRNHGMTADIS